MAGADSLETWLCGHVAYQYQQEKQQLLLLLSQWNAVPGQLPWEIGGRLLST